MGASSVDELDHLNRLIDTGVVLPGNTGKVRVLIELSRLISETPGLSILDIGCIGPSPLDFWRSLFALYGGQFSLTGIDPDQGGIERARSQFSYPGLTLLAGNGYDLTRLFPAQPFDVIVFTQVLEHVFHYDRFLQQVAQVCRAGGHVLFSLDSGHYPRGEVLKTSVKGILARLGREGHYEHGWRDQEVEPALQAAGLEVASRGYYCLTPLKKFHNRYFDEAQKNEFMRQWYTQESAINRHIRWNESAKSQFLGLFYHARKK
jgi:2-polyprenyl-3-methyl-5-hydroxy-6-metoxy-1,4-benzoquinol methylase